MGITRLEIDLKALSHNYNYLKEKLSSGVSMMAVVKAFGYGSDSAVIAAHLEALGVSYFAVAYASEGVTLRKAGITKPILVLHPQADNFALILEHCLEPSLYSARIFRAFIAFAKAQQQKHYPVHLKFNTGLNRLGFWESDTDWIIKELKKTDTLHIKSMFSHLAASEDMEETTFTLQQITTFKSIAERMSKDLGYRPLLHQSNTSAILNYPDAQMDIVRTGIGLYGYSNDPTIDKELIPVATLKTIISQIHMIEPEESVGYNRAYKAKGFEKTATLPIGHADGISRALGNEIGYVWIEGQKAPIIGNVCMDMMMINISHIDCKEGDEVIVFGQGANVVTLAEQIQSISYELLTAVSQRVKRVILR